jgi:hypothetical protein
MVDHVVMSKCIINGGNIDTIVTIQINIIYTSIKAYKIYVNTIAHPFHILQLYIIHTIYIPNFKCFDTIMHNMVSKFWKIIYINTKLVSQNSDIRPTLVKTWFSFSLMFLEVILNRL